MKKSDRKKHKREKILCDECLVNYYDISVYDMLLGERLLCNDCYEAELPLVNLDDKS